MPYKYRAFLISNINIYRGVIFKQVFTLPVNDTIKKIDMIMNLILLLKIVRGTICFVKNYILYSNKIRHNPSKEQRKRRLLYVNVLLEYKRTFLLNTNKARQGSPTTSIP